MTKECIISFDHPNGVYYSGQTLNGNVQLYIKSNKSINGVHVTIIGHGKVHWEETETVETAHDTKPDRIVSRRQKINYNGFNQYLNSRIFLLGYENCSSFNLAAGDYDYKFVSPLQVELPSTSFQTHGVVKYEVIVTILQPFGFNEIFQKEFTVIRAFDLNSDPRLKLPLNDSETSEYCCCCCCLFSSCLGDEGDLVSNCKIPKTGYAAGEQINFTVSIVNQSGRDVKKGEIKLKKEVTYISSSPGRKYKVELSNVVTKTLLFEVLKNSQKEFQEFIELPNELKPTDSKDLLIKVKYYFCLKVFSNRCCTSDMAIILPVTIGTVAINSTDPLNGEHSGHPTAPSEQMNQLATNPYFQEPSKQLLQEVPNSPGLSHGNEYHIEHKWLQIKGAQLQKDIPRGAFLAGYHNGDEMYIGRVNHQNSMLPAKVIPNQALAFVTWQGKELRKESFEILLGNQYEWMPYSKGEVPSNAMEAGEASDGQLWYIARGIYNGNHTVGKIQRGARCLLPYNGKEVSVQNYDVLVFSG